MIYSNYFIENKFQKPNNKIINQTHNIFFSKSTEKFKKLNKKVGLQENKSNDSFTIKNNNNAENKLINSSEFKSKFFLSKKNKKKKTIEC